MKALLNSLGKVDAERFISLIIREPFDYTKWQEDLFEDMGLEELGEKAMERYRKSYPNMYIKIITKIKYILSS